MRDIYRSAGDSPEQRIDAALNEIRQTAQMLKELRQPHTDGTVQHFPRRFQEALKRTMLVLRMGELVALAQTLVPQVEDEARRTELERRLQTIVPMVRQLHTLLTQETAAYQDATDRGQAGNVEQIW